MYSQWRDRVKFRRTDLKKSFFLKKGTKMFFFKNQYEEGI